MESSIERGGLDNISAAGLGVEVEAQRASRAGTTQADMVRLGRAFMALKATFDEARYISSKSGVVVNDSSFVFGRLSQITNETVDENGVVIGVI